MKEKIFFVDICNSLADVNSQLRNMGYRTDIYPVQIPAKVWADMSIFRNAHPIQSVCDFVKSLAGYKLIYLTARPIEARESTLLWLEKHGLPKAPLIHTNGRSKGEFVKAFSFDKNVAVVGAIEDSPHEIRNYTEVVPEMDLYIPQWEYNKHIDGKRLEVGEQQAA